MKSLFLPAIVLMNRMGYTKKFVLLALMSMVAFSMVAYSLFACLNKEISFLQRELEGIGLIGQVPKVVQLIQQHRVLSAGTLSGIETMRDERVIKEKEVIEAFNSMEGELPANLISSADWQNIKANWERLREKGLDLTQAECFAIHTRLIGQILLFGVVVADKYALTLDPEIDSYYLIDTVVNKLPQVIEYLAQLRASGIANLADKRITEPEKMSIVAVIGKLGDAINAFEINIGKAARYNPASQNTLLATAKNIADSAHQITGLVEADILTGRLATSPEDFYVTTSIAIDAGYSQMHGSLLSATEALIKERAAKAENTLRISIGIAILLLLVVTYFAIGIYHSIIDSVRSLARSAHTFADGDMRERVRLDTCDELGQIGDSFNKMADGFNAMLAARKQAEEDIQKSEMKFRTIYESSSDGIMLLDENGFLDCNDATLRVFGCPTRDSFINKHPSQFSPPTQPGGQDSMSLVNEHIAMAFKNGSNRFEWMHRRLDGTAFPANVWLTSLELNGRQMLQATVRDITIRKNAEENLRKSNEELAAINRQLSNTQNQLLQSEKILNEAQQLVHIGSWERDLMTNSLTCSEEILRIFEIDPAHGDISYEAFILTVHPDDREMVDHAYMTCIQAREPFDLVHRLLLSNGRVKWVNEHGTFYYDSNGVPLRSIGTIQDITERKLADDMLRVAAATFETHEGIVITDAHANIIRVNRAFQDITGYSQEEVLGKNPRVRSSGRYDKAFYAAMWQQLLDKGSWTGEVWNKHKDGQIYPEWLTITAVKNGQGETTEYVAIFSDITARKQAEDKLHKYNEELEAINHQLQDTQNQLLQSEKMSSIGQLAAGVAHEINNPIGYVHSNLGTLEKYVQDTFNMIDLYEQEEGTITDEAARARLKAAREELDIEFLKKDLRALMSESKDGITRVKKIVQDLKDFSHVDTSDKWHLADLHKGLDSTLNIVNNEIKYKASLVREYGDIPEVECLSSQLNQVFMNLLVNAAHAIEERGTITIRTGQQGEEVWVEIADTGKGITPEHIKRIFDPFFTTKPVGQGTGLGLSLSYGIIQKHYGRIEVESEVGNGTTFRVWLPVKQSREEKA